MTTARKPTKIVTTKTLPGLLAELGGGGGGGASEVARLYLAGAAGSSWSAVAADVTDSTVAAGGGLTLTMDAYGNGMPGIMSTAGGLYLVTLDLTPTGASWADNTRSVWFGATATVGAVSRTFQPADGNAETVSTIIKAEAGQYVATYFGAYISGGAQGGDSFTPQLMASVTRLG